MNSEPQFGEPANVPPPGADPASGARPEELPPVTPPSAGFIIQLFLIPALIVIAVIGAWALFGKIVGSDVDWQRLVSELGNNNEHRSWRAAQNLAQVLHQEQLARIPDEERLSSRREVAVALADLFQKSLDSPSTLDEDIRKCEFLARVMGALRVDDVVLPVVAEALSPDRDLQVRRNALISVALIAGRNFGEATGQSMSERSASGLPDLTALPDDVKLPLTRPAIGLEAIHEQLRLAAQDGEPTVRQLAAFTLGVVSGSEAMEQLRVLLQDGDSNTRANAAIALARNADAGGAAVMLELIEEGGTSLSSDQFRELSDEERQSELARKAFDEPTALLTCLTAVGRLWARIPEAQQADLRQAVRQLQESHESAAIRSRAGELLSEIGS